MAKTLYICYFGLREPLVQTQVIPYLLEIIKDDIEATLLTFEPDLKQKWTQEQIAAEREKLAEKGIKWVCLAYHKRFSVLATAYDVFRGSWLIRGMISREKIDVLHGRVHIPTLMGAIARRFSRRKPKLLFDIRGFFPEEYTDAGVWPADGWLYRSAKRVERWLLKEADGFVVLTEKAREILFPETEAQPPRVSGESFGKAEPFRTSSGTAAEGYREKFGRPVEVIPCCVDLKKFETANAASRSEVRDRLKIGDRKVIAYVGSFGGWYLTDQMLDFFTAARRDDPTIFALILTQRDKQTIKDALLSRGFSEADLFVDSVLPGEIPVYLSAADIAVSFIKACYSKLSSSPTKIAEYLACGVPVISNHGVGDIDSLIEGNGVGVLIDEFSDDAYITAIDGTEISPVMRDKCRQTAHVEFDLEQVGGVRYRRLYSRLLGRKAD